MQMRGLYLLLEFAGVGRKRAPTPRLTQTVVAIESLSRLCYHCMAPNYRLN